jgi:hypothetical protein
MITEFLFLLLKGISMLVYFLVILPLLITDVLQLGHVDINDLNRKRQLLQ